MQLIFFSLQFLIFWNLMANIQGHPVITVKYMESEIPAHWLLMLMCLQQLIRKLPPYFKDTDNFLCKTDRHNRVNMSDKSTLMATPDVSTRAIPTCPVQMTYFLFKNTKSYPWASAKCFLAFLPPHKRGFKNCLMQQLRIFLCSQEKHEKESDSRYHDTSIFLRLHPYTLAVVWGDLFILPRKAVV